MIDLNNLSEYKGIFLILIVVIVIVFYAKDMEGILLMTGILVNIIAICSNTGVTSKFTQPSPPPHTCRCPEGCKKKEPEPEPEPKKEKEKEFLENKCETPIGGVEIAIAGKYKGAVDYEECHGEQYDMTAMDKSTTKSLNRAGNNYKRQISGAMKRRQTIQPYICSELTDEEHKDWWSQYDM